MKARKITRIDYASQKKILRYEKEVFELLGLFGITNAWISDESVLGHLPVEKISTKKLEKHFGFKLKETDLIVDIAKKIRENNGK
jgi:hypothetical protein